MNIRVCLFLICLFLFACKQEGIVRDLPMALPASPYITVLGITQDAGYPHINNNDEFERVASDPSTKELVVSLGLVDPINKKKFLFDATPDMPEQLYILERNHLKTDKIIDGVFLTHAHIGHYTGLMYFGREAMGARNIRVMAMPKMKSFLENNGPWDQLVQLNNIKLLPLKQEVTVQVSSSLKVTPFIVPHRDEYSETVGYKIAGPNKTALFIPDIDKWSKWEKNIVKEVQKVDYAFLDATFFKDGEIPRSMSEVPHPFVEETVSAFANLPYRQTGADSITRSKVIFIHFNHSNPALRADFKERISLENLGYKFAEQDAIFPL